MMDIQQNISLVALDLVILHGVEDPCNDFNSSKEFVESEQRNVKYDWSLIGVENVWHKLFCEPCAKSQAYDDVIQWFDYRLQ